MKNQHLDSINISNALLRISLALIIFPHGAQKMLGWFGGYGFEGTMAYFTNTLGIPFPIALLVILIEFVCPVLLVLGLFTRIASALLFTLFVGIIFSAHLEFGFFMNWFGNQKGEGYEYHLLVLAISLAIVIQGAGKFTISQLLKPVK